MLIRDHPEVQSAEHNLTRSDAEAHESGAPSILEEGMTLRLSDSVSEGFAGEHMAPSWAWAWSGEGAAAKAIRSLRRNRNRNRSHVARRQPRGHFGSRVAAAMSSAMATRTMAREKAGQRQHKKSHVRIANRRRKTGCRMKS